MSVTPWLKANGRKIMSPSGNPVECEECPCDQETCAERLESTYRQMLASPEWRFLHEERAHYDCEPSDSTISYDGTLVVLMARDLSFSSPHKYAVHAYEFENVATGVHRTIACLCGCGSDWAFATLDNYGIALLVEADNESQCLPANMCEVYEAELDYVAGWHGGVLHGEGFYDLADQSNIWRYQVFRKALEFDDEGDEGEPRTQKMAYIECPCNARATVITKAGILSVHDVYDICDSPCQDLFVLKQLAWERGWTWHDAGIIACHAYWADVDEQTWATSACGICDWYEKFVPVMGCADDGERWNVVFCDCDIGLTRIPKQGWIYWWDGMTDPPDAGLCGELECDYFEIPWICECRQQRELMLAYPEIFGVESIVFGSDQIVEVTTSWEDPADGSTHTTTTKTTLGRLMGVDENYIDYRTMGVVRRRCRGGWNLICYNAPNSRFGGTHTFTYEQYQPVFLGRMRVPFGNDPDIGNRTGHVVAWWMTPCVARESQCFDNEQDAQDWYNQWGRNPSQPTPCGIRDYAQEAHESLMPPDLTLQYVTGGVEEIVHEEEWEDPDGGIHVDRWSEWCATPDYWCPAGGFRGYHGQAVYYVNWLETNRGWLVNGEDGYFPTLEIKGILQYNGGNCFGHSGVPEYDETLYPSAIDDDMHWCIPGFDFDPWESDSESI